MSGNASTERPAAELHEVVQAAREFVATTSYYRQRKESRAEFERLAFALLNPKLPKPLSPADSSNRG